jgi:spermidine synthase
MFIMGGGEGSAAREALKHKSMEKVVMCDIDQVINVQIGRKKKHRPGSLNSSSSDPGRLRIRFTGKLAFSH